jgi:hypothetical protein
MIRRILTAAVVTGAVATASVAMAPIAQAKPKEATTTCSFSTHFEFDVDGKEISETARWVCTTRFPDGGSVRTTEDDGTLTEVCHRAKGSAREYCADPNS